MPEPFPRFAFLKTVALAEKTNFSNRVKKIKREIRRSGEPGVAGNTVPRADLVNLELTYGAETYMAFLGLTGST